MHARRPVSWRGVTVVLASLVAGFVLWQPAVAVELLQAIPRRFNFAAEYRATNTGAALTSRQDGSGSIHDFKDGATSEFTIDQSSSTTVNPLNINGSANVYQLAVKAASTQSTPPFAVLNSSGTPVASISNAGALTVGSMSSITSAAVITTSNGTLWTVPASQTWVVHRVICNITTNFDCTGDDCALIIGDGNDTDGFLVLADAELQAADTEGTGFAAGWQGLVAATVGAYLDPEGTFVYAATDTIDIDVRDASAGTNPTAGAATCYLDYSRWN